MRLARALGSGKLGVIYDLHDPNPKPLSPRMTPYWLGVWQKRYENKLKRAGRLPAKESNCKQ